MLHNAPPDPVIRFRLRTLLGVTTVVAGLTAMAAPFLRQQTAEVRLMLLSYWSCIATTAGLSLYFRWRGAWTPPEKAGPPRYAGWTTGQNGNNLASRPTITILIALSWVALVGFYSSDIIMRGERVGPWHFTITGLAHGSMISGFLLIFVQQPFYFCERGVAFSQVFVPWKYIRSAEWKTPKRTVLRLHRLDGDLFVAIPEDIQEGLSALLAEHTNLNTSTMPVEAFHEPPT